MSLFVINIGEPSTRPVCDTRPHKIASLCLFSISIKLEVDSVTAESLPGKLPSIHLLTCCFGQGHGVWQPVPGSIGHTAAQGTYQHRVHTSTGYIPAQGIAWVACQSKKKALLISHNTLLAGLQVCRCLTGRILLTF